MIFYFQSFLLGVLAAGGALILELTIEDFYRLKNFSKLAEEEIPHILHLILLAVVIEELLKFFMIYKKTVPIFLEKKSLIAGSFFVGLGFGITEISLIIKGLESEWLVNLKYIWKILALQTLTGVLMGSIISLVKKLRKKFILIFIAPIAAIVAHFSFNYLTLKSDHVPDYAISAYLGLLFVFCLALIAICLRPETCANTNSKL